MARKQASKGVLPRFSPTLFFIALFSSFNTLSPAYCSGPLDDEAVASPVSEGAQAPRGASAAGEYASTFWRAASRPGGQEQLVEAIYNVIPTAAVGATGYYYGQAQANQVTDSVDQVGEKVDQMGEKVDQMGEKVDRLSTEVENLSEQESSTQQENTRLQDENDRLTSENQRLRALTESQSAELSALKAQQSKSFWSRWFCVSKPRTIDD